MVKYCVGIDLGGTSVKFGLFDVSGMLYEQWQLPTDTSESGKNILPDIADSLRRRLGTSQIDRSEIKGIGIGIPGIVTGEGLVSAAVNLGWTNVEVTRELANLTGLPVKTMNDGNTAALGEMWQGSGKGYKNLVMITLGTGIGGGIIIDEQPVSGCFGAAGELGHMTVVNDETEYCRCGRKGCLEQAASATGIAREAKRLLSEHKYENSVLTANRNINARSVADAAKAGDRLACDVMERAGRFLGLAMAIITGVIDPEAYIIGGGVSMAGEFFLDMIQRHYRENVLFISQHTKIRLAGLGNAAGIYGAARLVL